MPLEGCACCWGPFPGASVGSRGWSTLLHVRAHMADCWGPSWEPCGAGVYPSDTVFPPLTDGGWCLPQWCLCLSGSGATHVPLLFHFDRVVVRSHICVVLWSRGLVVVPGQEREPSVCCQPIPWVQLWAKH